MNAVSDFVVARSGSDLRSQIETMSKLSRSVAKREADQDRVSHKELAKAVCEVTTFEGVDFTKVDLPHGGRIRVVKDDLPTLEWHDSGIDWATAKVAEMTSNRVDATDSLMKLLSTESKMLKEEHCDPLTDPHPVYRPSLCRRFGYGHCICTLPGKLFWMAKNKLMQWLLLVCPPGSQARKWLLEGYIFVQLSPGQLWLHAGLVYLNPQRFTWLQVKQTDSLGNGRSVLSSFLRGDGMPPCFADLEALMLLEIDKPLSVVLYRLVCSDRPMVPFAPGQRIVVDRLEKHPSS